MHNIVLSHGCSIVGGRFSIGIWTSANKASQGGEGEKMLVLCPPSISYPLYIILNSWTERMNKEKSIWLSFAHETSKRWSRRTEVRRQTIRPHTSIPNDTVSLINNAFLILIICWRTLIIYPIPHLLPITLVTAQHQAASLRHATIQLVKASLSQP